MNVTGSLSGADDDSAPPAKKPKKLYHPVKTPAELKEERDKRQARRSRIIVRNLSFKSTEENLRQHFEQFGALVELNLLKRPDGKLVGCAFVQYETVTQAATAILKCTGKELMGRVVSLDWAVNKDTYGKHEQARKMALAVARKAEVKVEPNEEDVSVKSEAESDGQVDDADEEDTKPEQNDDSDEEIKQESDDEEGEEDDVKPKKVSNDLVEGCTVFIKNVPFDASETDFKRSVLQFGAIYYALLNKDPVSGHSKGTGFVKFRAKESADMCLQAGTEFKLLDQVLDPVIAVTRHDIKKKFDESKNHNPADSRNLYLTKEGMITAGSKAAEEVSPGDMAKRLRLEQIKTQMLKDLNRFVARERLTVHNIPEAYDADKLRRVVEMHTKLKVMLWFCFHGKFIHRELYIIPKAH